MFWHSVRWQRLAAPCWLLVSPHLLWFPLSSCCCYSSCCYCSRSSCGRSQRQINEYSIWQLLSYASACAATLLRLMLFREGHVTRSWGDQQKWARIWLLKLFRKTCMFVVSLISSYYSTNISYFGSNWKIIIICFIHKYGIWIKNKQLSNFKWINTVVNNLQILKHNCNISINQFGFYLDIQIYVFKILFK